MKTLFKSTFIFVSGITIAVIFCATVEVAYEDVSTKFSQKYNLYF